MDLLIELVNDLGYFAMFVFSWLIFIGFPLPNEAAAAFSGVLTEWKGYSPLLAFTSTYLGVISSGTFGYAAGRWAKNRIGRRFKASKSRRLIEKGHNWLEKYGALGISFSYFIPGVRLFMPYIAGASGISMGKFILAAYPAAFLWCTIYFNIGRFFPSTFTIIIDHIAEALAVGAAVVVIIIFSIVYFKRRRLAGDSK